MVVVTLMLMLLPAQQIDSLRVLEPHAFDSLGVGQYQVVHPSDLIALLPRLVLPSQAKRGRYLGAELVVENTGPVPFLFPSDLQPGHGFVRIDWTRSDGAKGSVGQLGAGYGFKSLELPPGSFYGQRFDLGTFEGPCVRMSRTDVCNWEPGSYVFTATIRVSVPPSQPVNQVSRPLATGSWTTEPVAVEVVN